MITITRTVIQEIDEMKIFDSVKDFLFDEEIEFTDFNYETLSQLPKDAQRFIFAKIGAMLIDYSKSEGF